MLYSQKLRITLQLLMVAKAAKKLKARICQEIKSRHQSVTSRICQEVTHSSQEVKVYYFVTARKYCFINSQQPRNLALVACRSQEIQLWYLQKPRNLALVTFSCQEIQLWQLVEDKKYSFGNLQKPRNLDLVTCSCQEIQLW